VPGEHVRPGLPGRPFAPECRKIGYPIGEVVDVTGDGVRAQPTGARLPTPVERGDAPASRVPVRQRLEILLIGVAPAGQEQQAAAGARFGLGPIDPAERMAVRRQPAALAGVGWNGASVESPRFRRFRLANTSLLPVVTF
jgi:hypothetical protein